MIGEICKELNNWFVVDDADRCFSEFTISDGVISPLDFVQKGQYFRIIGSVFNDGVYKNDDDLKLQDETFDGCVWAMRIPADVIKLSADISAWMDKNGEAVTSPYASESFGGYSYTKSTGANGENNATWQKVFSNSLKKWRKI